MNKQSILIGISGSEQSLNAAEIAWKLARDLNFSVTAEHIVDSATVWELLRCDMPGLVGSGPYVEMYEEIIDSLKSLANKLSLRYEALAAGAAVTAECNVKDGNPVKVLCEDSKKHALVVIGHIPSSQRKTVKEFCHYVRHSIAEGIAHECTVPVLIVQSKPAHWKTMTIVSEIDHINIRYIRSCMRLAKKLSLLPSLEFWGTGTREESAEELKKDLFSQLPEAENTEVEIEYFPGHTAIERKDLIQGQYAEQAALIPSDTLFVLPTRGIAKDRYSVFGIEPEQFVRCLNLPCLLLWPEDHSAFETFDETETEAVAAG
ncbi:MAG: universal stress protein [Candidatus Melainabacteria bacterium]|jgi:nucleotide-binding universal stress UspA family protein|nr:universal stress protein [Candidatus Melainabacteria bacterium]